VVATIPAILPAIVIAPSSWKTRFIVLRHRRHQPPPVITPSSRARRPNTVINFSILNVAHASISRTLRVTQTSLEMIVAIYDVVFAVFEINQERRAAAPLPSALERLPSTCFDVLIDSIMLSS
jgi:hypothetical protein